MRRQYAVKEGKLVRTNPFCPRCGEGVFMADKGEWQSRGKCGDRYLKKKQEKCLEEQTKQGKC